MLALCDRVGSLRGRAAIVILVSLLSCPLSSRADEEPAAADVERGKQLFAQQCERCHGDQGQGVEDYYPEPLQGDHPVSHLQELIELTMPEEDPDACVGDDARDVAAFVHDRFYSEAAKQRRQAARTELSRLTVPQYRNSVTDLVQSFRSPPELEKQGVGLQARYFQKRNFKKEVIERTDPVIDFDFGEDVPESNEDFDDEEEFSIRWQGGLFVEKTGTYKLRLYAENGVRLWVNDPEEALIDGWVRSGDKTEHVESVFLLGGRTYPIRLDFHKRKDPSAAVSLQWEPPGGVVEPIPQYHLSRGKFPKLFVAETTFPPDDRSIGYERGTRVTKEWAEATTHGAIETANAVLRDLDSLAGIGKDDSKDERREKATSFCRTFVQRAFRRPLDDEQQDRYVDRHFAAEELPERAVKRVIVLALKSPQFLYPTVGLERDLAVASRLSYALGDGPPDPALLDAAREGELATSEQVIAQGRRLLDDPRSRAKLRAFVQHWLQIDRSYDLSKDADAYPEFTPRLVVDLHRSLDRFVEATVWDEASDFRQLLCSDTIWVNEPLAEFFGVDPPEKDGFQPVQFENEPRSGVVTHPFLMASLAHRSASSPIHRGVFLARGILGRTLKSPPDAIELVDASLLPDMTTRQRVEEQTKPDSCQNCHRTINSLGFALEHYDAVGRYRKKENAGPVDAGGAYQPTRGETIEFSDARELAEALAEHDETTRNFIERMFEFLTKQPIRGYRAGLLDELTDEFVASDYHIRDLAVRIASVAALQDP